VSYDKFQHMITVSKCEIEYWQEIILRNKNDKALIDLSLDSQKRLFNIIDRVEKMKVRV
jgi:hypothetical protein